MKNGGNLFLTNDELMVTLFPNLKPNYNKVKGESIR